MYNPILMNYYYVGMESKSLYYSSQIVQCSLEGLPEGDAICFANSLRTAYAELDIVLANSIVDTIPVRNESTKATIKIITWTHVGCRQFKVHGLDIGRIGKYVRSRLFFLGLDLRAQSKKMPVNTLA